MVLANSVEQHITHPGLLARKNEFNVGKSTREVLNIPLVSNVVHARTDAGPDDRAETEMKVDAQGCPKTDIADHGPSKLRALLLACIERPIFSDLRRGRRERLM